MLILRRVGVWGWTWSCIGDGKWKQIDVTIPEPCNLGQNPVHPDSIFEFLFPPITFDYEAICLSFVSRPAKIPKSCCPDGGEKIQVADPHGGAAARG